MSSRPLFSLCHATARLPDGWRAAHKAWKDNADDWASVEYVLCIDLDDRETHGMPLLPGGYGRACIAINRDRKCPVDAWNMAAAASSGQILITAADDMFPPPHWDTALLAAIPSLDRPYAIEVKSGTSPADDDWMRVMLHSIITRPYYELVGNFLYPEYVGYYADCDFTEMARRDGVVIDARHLTFQHRHWIGTAVPHDEVYQRQDSEENRTLGMRILGERRERNFAGGNRVIVP